MGDIKIKYVNAFNLNSDNNEKYVSLNKLSDIIYKNKGLKDKGINERIKEEEDIIYLYFDIDYEIEDYSPLKQNKLNKLLIYLNNNFNVIRHLRGYYLKNYDDLFKDCEDIKKYFDKYEPEEQTPKTKIFSSHLIFDYSDYYKNIIEIINDFCKSYNCVSKKDIDFIDVKAYNKTCSIRLLRNIYSPKCLTLNNIIKCYVKFNEEIDTKEYIEKSFIQTNIINKDIDIEYFIDNIFNICINSENEIKEVKEIKIINETSEPSIFEGIKNFNENLNSFETIQLFYNLDCILSEDIIKKEIYLFLKYYEPLFNLYGLNEEWINKVLNMYKYKQDKKNIKTLYFLLNKQLDRKNELKDLKDYDNLKRCQIAINKIDNYINKNLQTWFINIEHFDINENIEFNKQDKIIMNVFKDLNDCYYLINDNIKTFTNKTQLRNYLHCSSKTINKISDKIICFKSLQDYNLKVLENKYNSLNDEELNKINEYILKLLELLKLTFIDVKDYNIYLNWWHEKLKSPNKQIKKNIINCPFDFNESGKDSLKTYFKDLFIPFIEESKPTYKEMIKTLSGAYFDVQLITIEEINTFNIKEKSELIEKIKMTTETTKLNIEQKNQNAILKDVRFNYYINTNHDISSLFINKSDCEPLIKRFKIFKRKTIKNINDYNDILDFFNKNDTNNLNKYCLMKYIINNISDYDFYNCELNEYEKKLLNDSMIEENDKILIEYDLNDFKNIIKDCYINDFNHFNIRSFYDKYFVNYKLNYKSLLYTLKHNGIIEKYKSNNHYKLINIDKLINDFFETK